MEKTWLIIFLSIFFIFNVIFSATFAGQPIPKLIGRINDFADMLTSSEEIELERLLENNERVTSNQIVVVTIETLRGEVLENYSIRLADKWKIGQKGRDNGVILLIVKQERKLRMEVGYGLEGALPDGFCGSIIREKIAPLFKKGSYFLGIKNGLYAIINTTKRKYGYYKTTEHRCNNHLEMFLLFLFFLAGGLALWMIRGFFRILLYILCRKKEEKWVLKLFFDIIFFIFGAILHYVVFLNLMIKPFEDFYFFTIMSYGIGLFFGSFFLVGHLYVDNFWSDLKESVRNSPSGGSGGIFGGGGGGFSGGGGGFGGGGASGGW
ncbi:MAG: TPM domain-containing protein [bacterium]